jgi:hypothetical protein
MRDEQQYLWTLFHWLSGALLIFGPYWNVLCFSGITRNCAELDRKLIS